MEMQDCWRSAGPTINCTFSFVYRLIQKYLIQFNEKTNVENIWMNGGIYHLSIDIAKILPTKGSLESIVFPKLAKKNSLNTVKFKNVLWRSIDSHKDIETCSKEMIQKKYTKFILKG